MLYSKIVIQIRLMHILSKKDVMDKEVALIALMPERFHAIFHVIFGKIYGSCKL